MLSYLAVLVAIVLIPGFLWERIDNIFSILPKRHTLKEQLMASFLFGAFTYIIIAIVLFVFDLFFGLLCSCSKFKICNAKIYTLNVLDLQPNKLNWKLTDIQIDLLISIPISFILSLCWLFAVKERWLPRIIRYMDLTTEFGFGDYWTFFRHSDEKEFKYVMIFDQSTKETIVGELRGSEEKEGIREILLKNVTVTSEDNTTGEIIPFTYISRPKDKIRVDFYKERPKNF